MGSLAHLTNSSFQEIYFNNKNSKIPEYAKNFKNEWLFIRGINQKCGELIKKIEKTDTEESVYLYKFITQSLNKNFTNILTAQKDGKLQDISKIKFKKSVVDRILELKEELYYMMGNSEYHDFFQESYIQEFFENFILFIHAVNIKYSNDYEDDICEYNHISDISVYNPYIGINSCAFIYRDDESDESDEIE